jgi:hypothetical protein
VVQAELPFPGAYSIGDGWAGIGGNASTQNAIVMKRDLSTPYNTIMMALNWSDIAAFFHPTSDPAGNLASSILNAVLPGGCGGGTTTNVQLLSPRVTALFQSYPNPANPMATLSFELAASSKVSLNIYDVKGRLVRTVVDEVLLPNRHAYVWDGRDNSGVHAASGLYLYRLQSSEFEQTRKLVLVR